MWWICMPLAEGDEERRIRGAYCLLSPTEKIVGLPEFW